MDIRRIFERLYRQEISPEEAERQFASPSPENTVTWDWDRPARRGFPESVFCPGKTVDELTRLVDLMVTGDKPVLFTRLSRAKARILQENRPEAGLHYYPRSRIMIWGELPKPDPSRQVAIVSGGTSDAPVAEEAALTLKASGISVIRVDDVGVAGLHRLMRAWDRIARVDVIIVVAGMEGALPSVVAGLSDRPVIAVPTSVGYGSHLKGLVPLLAMLNSCAEGVGVVNIDNGFGAARLASMILVVKSQS